MVRLAISERRDLLINAAWRVMARDGVAAATTRAICAEAGMPQSAFHYCFDTRADLLRLVITNRMPEHLEFAMGAVDAPGTPTERIRRALDAWWRDVVMHPERHAVLFDITLHAHYDPDLAGLGAYQYRAAHDAILTMLQHVVTDNQYTWDSDLNELAVTVLSFLDGITLRYVVNPENEAYAGVLDDFAANLAAHLTSVTSTSTR